MKKFKKILSLVLAVVLLISALPTLAFNITASALTSGNITYTVSNDEATIIDYNSTISGDIIIPSTLGGYPVTSIGYDAFSNCQYLKSITIPDSVKSIGDYAFRYCKRITSIVIPNSVTSIGHSAFYYCENLASITISDSVTSIGYNVFYGCPIKKLTIAEGSENVSSSIDEVLESELETIEIPKSVTNISVSFYKCKSLKNIIVDNYNSYYSSKDCVLFNKKQTEIICYPAGKSNTTYAIPDGVTTIGENAFYNCVNLTSLTIPNSVTSVVYTYYPFGNCTSLKNITVDKENSYYSSKDGVLFNKKQNEIIYYPSGKTTSSYAIPNNIKYIGRYAFNNCTSLMSITIPDSVINIGEGAFTNTGYYNNSSNWQNDVLYIGKHLIEAQTTLNGSYNIKSGTKTIAEYAFYLCSNVTSITIPDSVTSIGAAAFMGCGNLTNINIPNSVTSMGGFVFSVCQNLTSITIPSSLKSIGTYTFSNCKNLESVTIPYSVNSIDYGAFNECTNLKDVYYGGTESDWENVKKRENNTYLTNATIHYHTHNFGDWITTKESTCIENGEKYRICSLCEREEKGIIEPSLKNHSFENGICTICNGYLECEHDYAENTNETWTITKRNVDKITITFSKDTFLEEQYDFIYLYDANDNPIGKYTGSELAGKTITINSDTVKIQLKTDRVGNYYGFKITNIEFICEHNYIDESQSANCTQGGYNKYTCSKCGDSYTENHTEATGIHIWENGNCIYCDRYLECEHNYPVDSDETWTIKRQGAKSITITFSSDTFVEEGWDFIYIYDSNDKPIGEYTGSDLAGESVTINGDTAKIRLYSDRAYNYYGFKITDISAEYNIGDVNLDGETDVKDLVRLKKILAGIENAGGANTDLNNDTKTDSIDLTVLRKNILGIS